MLIDELEATTTKGVVLHWWLGNARLTDRAVRLGCYFSVNPSSARKREMLMMIPRDRLLTETDHPFGDRRGGKPGKPGSVVEVERSIARLYGLTDLESRLLIWRNLARLVRDVGCADLLPRDVRSLLAAVA
jgi:TatD DNase family protein